MSTHGEIEEGDQHKADVTRDGNSRQRAAAYKLNDQVKAETSSLKEDGQLRKYWDTWTVTAVQQNSVSWKYKLKHDDGSAYDGGNWVAESKLRDP